MQVATPRFLQVAMAGGDRFLATNIAAFRALTTDTQNQRPDRFVVQAIVQEDAAWLNPRHEDNYYIAAALLPWNGQLDAAQHILRAASESRPFDMLPPFFYAFNAYYFHRDPLAAAYWMKIAAEHSSDVKDRINLGKIAARWTEKGQDRHQVLKLLEVMAEKSRYRHLRQVILLRAERIRRLIYLDNAIEVYKQRHARLPSSLQELTHSGIIESLPTDPLGQGYLYSIDAQGKAQLEAPLKK